MSVIARSVSDEAISAENKDCFAPLAMTFRLSGYPNNLPKGVSKGQNPPVSRCASVGPLWQRGPRRRSRAGDFPAWRSKGIRSYSDRL
jgi:hypothetical protein